ncbi:MAG: DUF3152 domain-containing protein [Jatrophihabitantaceae bacterium]
MSRPSAPQRQRPPAGYDQPTTAGQPVPQGAQRGRWRSFVDRYGWRAYALPALAAITVLAVFTTNSPKVRAAIGGNAERITGHSATSSTPPNAASDGQLKVDTPGAGSVSTALPALALPPGPAYTQLGRGSYTTVPGHSAVIGHGRLYKFSIEVENGITGVDPKAFAAVVMSALSDQRSWAGSAAGGNQVAVQRVDSGAVDFHLSLVSAMTVRNLCGYSLPVETSCYDGGDSRVVLNVARWVRGAKAYASDLATYRIYAVNHEVGHALGHNHAHQCLKDGLAPVMMQQTIGDKTASGQICQANPWPFPKGATDAPGAEQAGDGPDLDFFQRNSH